MQGEVRHLANYLQLLSRFCIAAKNGVYVSLVKDVRDAFELSPLVKVDCPELEPSDYKKIGAKLKVYVSFRFFCFFFADIHCTALQLHCNHFCSISNVEIQNIVILNNLKLPIHLA